MMELHHGSILAFVLCSSVVDQSCSALSVNTSLSGLRLTASSCWVFPFRAAAPGARPSLDKTSNLTAEMDEQHPVHACVTASARAHTHTLTISPLKNPTFLLPLATVFRHSVELHTFLDRVAFTSSMVIFIPSYSGGFSTEFFFIPMVVKKGRFTHALRLLVLRLLGFFSKSVSWYFGSLSQAVTNFVPWRIRAFLCQNLSINHQD